MFPQDHAGTVGRGLLRSSTSKPGWRSAIAPILSLCEVRGGTGRVKGHASIALSSLGAFISGGGGRLRCRGAASYSCVAEGDSRGGRMTSSFFTVTADGGGSGVGVRDRALILIALVPVNSVPQSSVSGGVAGGVDSRDESYNALSARASRTIYGIRTIPCSALLAAAYSSDHLSHLFRCLIQWCKSKYPFGDSLIVVPHLRHRTLNRSTIRARGSRSSSARLSCACAVNFVNGPGPGTAVALLLLLVAAPDGSLGAGGGVSARVHEREHQYGALTFEYFAVLACLYAISWWDVAPKRASPLRHVSSTSSRPKRSPRPRTEGGRPLYTPIHQPRTKRARNKRAYSRGVSRLAGELIRG